MSDVSTTTTSPAGPGEGETAQVALVDLFLPGGEEGGLAYLDPPVTLLPDLDEGRLLERLYEMMAAMPGDGKLLSEERKPEKRRGLATQYMDIELRHALRLLLGFGDDPDRLAAHLEHCLADPAFGYGENGDNGRTIAQALQSTAAGDFRGQVADWLAAHAGLRQAIMAGDPLVMRSLFDVTELDTYVPVLQRIGDGAWRLGVEGQGKHRDFQGEIWDLWPRICAALVEWEEADQARWLESAKRDAARLPDTIQRAAWGDRLSQDRCAIRVDGTRIVVSRAEKKGGGEEERGWPRSLVLGDMAGLSRMSGHSLYELAWEGGLRVRHFEMSNTTRGKVPFEHTELAVRVAEAVSGAAPEPASPEEVEAAYLRRALSPRRGGEVAAEMGPPPAEALPPTIFGQAVASYRAGKVTVAVLHGGDDLAYAAAGEAGVVLRRDERRGAVMALPFARGRVRREPLMTTPLTEVEITPAWQRAMCAWAVWLAGVTDGGEA
jgi:hypothetical protein